MSLHHESKFETQVVLDMIQPQCGWIEGKSTGYDKKLALYPEDLISFIKITQPETYAKYTSRFKDQTDIEICKIVAKYCDKKGSLNYLREEIKTFPAPLKLCQFIPELSNPELQVKYDANICRVVRQVYYSENNQNSIDLVLFINGIPIITIELKTDFTQTVDDAIQQYKSDRLPKDKKTRKEEPLLAFKKRALVHFAVSTDEVYMTTKLVGQKTLFLPFNLGNNGGKGNPHNPDGFATEYLWQKVLSKDSLLKIISKYIHLEQKDVEDHTGVIKKKETLIFPRYHQLDVVRKLISSVKVEGVGQKYLIQHSAGSGKSNSIAWLSHQLSSIHNEAGQRIFDTVIVLTDRTVLDSQLKETITQFERVKGVVVPIMRNSEFSSKSSQLATALKNGAAIIPVTIQTFPFVLEEIQKTTTLKDKNFAIIADEAHSSQSGKTATKLKEVLNSELINDLDEISTEDVLNATMEARSKAKNLSFFAFTATPKPKTLELFGRLSKPDEIASATNTPKAFHIYTMQQAIEEGFIIDVLLNYTTYDMACRISSEDGHREVDSKEAKLKLKRYIKLHAYDISQKIDVILTHFKESIKHLLNGQAKAMVVTSSRKAAIRYKIEFDRFLAKHEDDLGYQNIQAMVAFSGKIIDDEETGEPKEYTETNMNPLLKGRDMRDAFDTDDYQVMLVANKFQTGFDQPKLCAMYVDKKLGGVDAVQTLSRLNRTHQGKECVFVLDFINKTEDIKEAFDPYYQNAEITDVTDPNVVYGLMDKLEDYAIYTDAEVEQYVEAYLKNHGNKQTAQKYMSAAIKPAADRFKQQYRQAIEAVRYAQQELDNTKEQGDEVSIKNAESHLKEIKEAKDSLDLFKKDLGTFIRMYEFLSQINDYDSQEIEKFCIYARGLLPNLHVTELSPQVDIGDIELTHYRLEKQKQVSIQLGGTTLETIKPGEGKAKDRKAEMLEDIVNQMNQVFAGEYSDIDSMNYLITLSDKVREDDKTMQQITANDKKSALEGLFPKTFDNALISCWETHNNFTTQAFSSEEKKALLMNLVADMLYQDKKSKTHGSTSA
jgi:type I restriction enzyme R subunit